MRFGVLGPLLVDDGDRQLGLHPGPGIAASAAALAAAGPGEARSLLRALTEHAPGRVIVHDERHC